MSTKNHTKSMSQPERAFWRDVFVAVVGSMTAGDKTIHQDCDIAAAAADLAVEQYRARVTWRGSHD